jgi:DNA-binding SARP family transcriptional activator
MDLLRIRLLGAFEIVRGGAILSPPATPKSRSLLAYMIINRDRLTHRETLCATLWPDEAEPVARKALRTAIWRVRTALDGDGYIYSDGHQVGFRGEAPVWVDIWDFEEVVAGIDSKSDDALDAADGEGMARAAALYRGQYAAGVYDEWLTVEQSRLEHAHLALLARMAAFHANHQRWLQAIAWAERALAFDPLREHLHRSVMACYMSLGDRASALRQYARCEAALRTELGIEPMAETKYLHNQIQGRPAPRPAGQQQPGRSIIGPDGGRHGDPRLDSEIDAAVSTLRRVTRRLGNVRGSRRSKRATAAPI